MPGLVQHALTPGTIAASASGSSVPSRSSWGELRLHGVDPEAGDACDFQSALEQILARHDALVPEQGRGGACHRTVAGDLGRVE